MKLLPEGEVRDRYDVIVVGSGLSSLTAAALVARGGLSTLLVEHHYLPGGMCTTLRRKGFSFDTGTALMYGFGERGVNPHRFVMNQLEADVDVIEHQALLRMHFNGKPIVFWPDYDRFVSELCAAFPKQADEVRALYSYLHKLYFNVIASQQMVVPPTEIPPQENLKKLLRHPAAMLASLRMLSMPTEKVLRRFVKDPELMAFFDKLCSVYVYCTAAETPAILAATMFVDNHVGGAYYPARSPQVYSSTLEKALEDAGGQTLYGRRVDEILIEGGKATGVRFEDGTIVRARAIVAGVTVWNLYGKLVRPEFQKPGRADWAKSLVPTYASLVLYIGVKAEAIPAGTLPVEMLIADIEGVNQGDLTLYISSLDDPSICPPGTHAITTIAPSPEPWPSPWSEEYRSADYRERKAAAVARTMDQIETLFPDLRRNILVLEAGTPATIERYTLKNGGAVGGPKQAIGQQLMKRLHGQSDWPNLFLCGDSTVMGMGTPAVTVSGIGAANLVLRAAGKPEYGRREFERQRVHIVKGKPLAPLPSQGEPLDPVRAMRLARECQYCEAPDCTCACPTGNDIRNVMRRIEAGNFAGAARALRQTNPLAEVFGHICRPGPSCERHCLRMSFADGPVRIAELEAWVCREAGDRGWRTDQPEQSGKSATIIGAGPAGLSCAYFLARAGWKVTLWDKRAEPGGSLLDLDPALLTKDVLARDLNGVLHAGAIFSGDKPVKYVGGLAQEHTAVVIAAGIEGKSLVAGLDAVGDGLKAKNNVVACGAVVRGHCSALQAVADGRAAARMIGESYT
ncbi:MAG TPA: FAD-dependent oxidoreductase [bacterium]|nr:FAD-dependent oxidoreductase [bacterium]